MNRNGNISFICNLSCARGRGIIKSQWIAMTCHMTCYFRGRMSQAQFIFTMDCRGGSASIRNLYSYVTSSGDIRYDNRNYAAIVQRKSRVRGQISAPSVPSCVCANELSFKICVFQVVKSPQSRRDRCYCYRRHVRTL